jgi:hypothetical protein
MDKSFMLKFIHQINLINGVERMINAFTPAANHFVAKEDST